MKNNLFKKIAALALAAVMTMGMSVSVYATSTQEEGTGTSGTAITSVDIPVDIVVYNTAGETIYEPNITYTYSLAVQNPSTATIKDKNGYTATVKTGVAGGVTIVGNSGSASTSAASLVFGGDTAGDLATNTEGTAVTTSSKVSTAGDAEAKLTLAFDTSVFTEAGVYRYKISDTTTDAALTAAGIVRSDDFDPNRYLDVYIEWTDDTHTALQVYGYVLYKTTDGTANVDGTSSLEYDADGTTSLKVTGYDIESEMLEDASTADEYHTYNLKVTKTTTGSMADLTNEFPIAITFNNATVKSETDFYSTDDFVNAALALSNAGAYTVNLDFSSTPSVKNGDTFTFVGLPAGTTFIVNEKNNTPDSYSVVINDATTSTDLFASAIVNAGANTNLTTKIDLANAKGSNYETEDIQITNTLEAISPTGYVTRVAPFALMLGFAVVILIIVRRRREDNQTDII